MDNVATSRKRSEANPDSLLVSMVDAAKMIGVSRSTLMRTKGMDDRFPRPVKIMHGGKPMYRRADIVKYVEELPTE